MHNELTSPKNPALKEKRSSRSYLQVRTGVPVKRRHNAPKSPPLHTKKPEGTKRHDCTAFVPRIASSYFSVFCARFQRRGSGEKRREDFLRYCYKFGSRGSKNWAAIVVNWPILMVFFFQFEEQFTTWSANTSLPCLFSLRPYFFSILF